MLEEEGKFTTRSLRTFVLYMDRFFDCLNTSRRINKSRKEDLNPYYSPDDMRFEVSTELFIFVTKKLQNVDFLNYKEISYIRIQKCSM